MCIPFLSVYRVIKLHCPFTDNAIIMHLWDQINKESNTYIIIIVVATSASDLQPSTAIANQLFGQLVSTQVRTIGLKIFLNLF